MSDSDNEVEETEQEIIYRFKIVKFIKRGRKGLKKEIDIVPATWIHWDDKTKRLKVPFLPAPYTNEDIKLLHDIVKSEFDAPESWPIYNVDIIGEARTYKSAVSRLLLLEKAETAFSQDSEDDDIEKIKKAEITYKQKKLKNNEKEIRQLFEVPSLQEKTCGRSGNNSKIRQEKSKNDASANSKVNNVNKRPTKSFNILKENVIKQTTEKENYTITDLSTDIPEENITKQTAEKENCTVTDLLNVNSQFAQNLVNIPEENITKQTTTEKENYAVTDLWNEQTPLELLLDANVSVLSNSIGISNEGSNVLSSNNIISKKYQESFDKEITIINIKLDSLSVKIESLMQDIKVVKNHMLNQVQSNKNTDFDNIFLKKYNIKFPFNNKEDFKKFNDRLSNDTHFRLNFCQHLRRYVDYSTTLSKNVTSMIKMIITRHVAMEYTASKVTTGKALMKDEHFYACIEDVLLQNEIQGEVVTTKLLLKALSSSLCNAKDWDGHRKDRDGQRKDQ